MWDETAAVIEVIWVGAEQQNFLLWDSTAPTTPNLARRAVDFFTRRHSASRRKTKIWHVRAQLTARRATGLQGGLVSRNHFHRLHRRHPRESGEPVHTNACVYWIPAFAGMTAVAVAPKQIISNTPSGRRFRQNPWRRYPNRPSPCMSLQSSNAVPVSICIAGRQVTLEYRWPFLSASCLSRAFRAQSIADIVYVSDFYGGI